MDSGHLGGRVAEHIDEDMLELIAVRFVVGDDAELGERGVLIDAEGGAGSELRVGDQFAKHQIQICYRSARSLTGLLEK